MSRGVLCFLLCWVSVLVTSVRTARAANEGEQGKRSDDIPGSLGVVVENLTQRLAMLEAHQQAAQRTITGLEAKVFTQGIAGGAFYVDPGTGANRLCLTSEPVFDRTDYDVSFGQIEGVEYFIPGHHNTDVLCAACRTAHADTFMVPGTNRCPAGSVMQYHGHLTSGNHASAGSTEYLCLDASPEDRQGSHKDESSAYFVYVRTRCGALPCPPYADDRDFAGEQGMCVGFQASVGIQHFFSKYIDECDTVHIVCWHQKHHPE